jgi:hypothetical protein
MTLLLSIARCEQLLRQLAPEADTSHPCHQVVSWQARNGIAPQQVPEPWNGDVERAPLLFISSNPAISAVERYPNLDWADDDITRFFTGRFGDAPDAPIAGGTRVLNTDGSRGRANPFLSWIRARAVELECPEPGVGYALTEVVHCKSSNEVDGGVGQAWEFCLESYGQAVLALSGARVWVFVGVHAARAAHRLFALSAHQPVQGPLSLLGRDRMAVFMPHPNSRGGRKTFSGCLCGKELQALRDFVKAGTVATAEGAEVSGR